MGDPVSPVPAHPATAAPAKSGWLNLVVDYGPIAVFFVVYRHFAPADHSASVQEVGAVVYGTLAFMAAAMVALTISLLKFRRVSPMLALSTALIVFFGGLTVLLRDPFYIQIKPTAIYLMFATALLIGWLRGRALLKVLLEAAFEGLDDAGWMLLSRNWGWFFLFLALLNEGLRYFYNTANHNFGTWIALKLWLFMPLSFLFTFIHLPMLMRHGLGMSAADHGSSEIPQG